MGNLLRRDLRWVALFIVLSRISCEDYMDVMNLSSKLLQNYSRSIIPKRNQSETIKLEMDISLKALNKFDVVDGQMTMVTAMALKWKDQLLSWDPKYNKDINELSFPLAKVWSPNLYLLNCAQEFLIYKGDPDTKEVEFSSSGQARLFFMEVLTTTCTSDITYYPNDIHHCKIYLSTLTSAFKLRMGLAEVDIVNFETNGEWKLGNIRSEVEFLETQNIERVVITIALERRMLFHMINVVAPVVFLGFVNVIVFKLPVDSGERMSFAMTVLLSFAVYMTLIADKMPQTSNTTSVFCLYLMAMLIYSTLITLATTLSIHSHHIKKDPLMKYLEKIPSLLTTIRKNKQKKMKGISVEEMNLPQNDNTEFSDVDNIHKTKRFDKILFVFFLMYFIIATLILFVQILVR